MVGGKGAIAITWDMPGQCMAQTMLRASMKRPMAPALVLT